MRLYKRKDSKFYWYKFMVDGVVYQASTKTKNRPAAEGIASAARLKVIEGKYDIKRQQEAPHFKDAMETFLDHVRQHNAEGTATRYESSSKPLNKAFGKKRLTKVTAKAIGKYKTARLNDDLMPATINAELRRMRAMFTHFVELETIVKSPAKKVKLLPEDNEKDRILSPEEERLYLAACPQPLHDIAVLILETGMRPGEIFRMRGENVNLAAGSVFNPYG